MIELEPNKTPDGQKCGNCRFALTHTCAQDTASRVRVACRRYPPARRGDVGIRTPDRDIPLRDREVDTVWPVLTWDDWCGEWRPRVDAPPKREISDEQARDYFDAMYRLARENPRTPVCWGMDLGRETTGSGLGADQCLHDDVYETSTGDGVSVEFCRTCGVATKIGKYPRDDDEREG